MEKRADQLVIGDFITFFDERDRRRSMRVDGIRRYEAHRLIWGAMTTNANPKKPSLTKDGVERWTDCTLSNGDTVTVW